MDLRNSLLKIITDCKKRVLLREMDDERIATQRKCPRNWKLVPITAALLKLNKKAPGVTRSIFYKSGSWTIVELPDRTFAKI